MSFRGLGSVFQVMILGFVATIMPGCGGGGGGGNPQPAPTISSFSASPAAIPAGQSSTLSWNVSGATGLSIDQGVGSVTGSSKSVTPASTATYTLTASNGSGSASATTTVTVVPAPLISSFTANPASITTGQSSTLSWSVSGATGLSIDQGIGAVTGASRIVSPTVTTTYELSASNTQGGVTATVTRTTMVTVTAPTGFNFGNAPDGTSTGYPNVFGIINPAQTGAFPTLLVNNGGRAQSVADGILGTQAKQTPDAVIGDVSDVDGLQDMLVVLTSIPPPAQMTVKVTAPPGSAGGTMYLNTLFDKNMNGSWNEASEWVVKNHPVTLPAPGNTVNITPPAFAFSNGNILPDPAWMRIALTREQIGGGVWDGSGLFNSGEVEDYLVHLSALPGNPPKKVPILTVQPGGPYKFPNGVGNLPIQFTVTNSAAVAGNFNYTLVKLSGNVGVGGWDKAPPVPIGSSLAIDGSEVVVIKGNANSPAANALPSQWQVTVEAIDPPALFVPGGVYIGVGSATGILDFSSIAAPAHTLTPYSMYKTHTRGVSPCPDPFQSALTLTNVGGVDLTWSCTAPPAWLSLGGAATSGTLAPGANVVLPLYFTCSSYAVGLNQFTFTFTVRQTGTTTPSDGQTTVAIDLMVI